MRIFIISVIIFSAALLLCSCQHSKKILTEKEIFSAELQDIYNQHLSLRKEKILQALRRENKQASTLSNFANLELMLDDYELSEAEKNKNILRYFDHAMLYMQILIFPEKKEFLLEQQIKNNLIFEISSIFLKQSIAKNFLAAVLKNSDNAAICNSYSEMLENQKIEYSVMRINDLNMSRKMPALSYPLHETPPFTDINSFLQIKSPDSDIFQHIQPFYSDLLAGYGNDLSLILLKILYQTPHELNNFYNDSELKRDFCIFFNHLVYIHVCSQLFNNMHNTFLILQDMHRAVSGEKTPTAEMQDALAKSRLAYELAILECLSYTGLTPFDVITPSEKKSPIPASRISTLKLIFHDILKRTISNKL